MARILPDALLRLIKNFEALPGVGEKTATRYALFVMRSEPAYALEFAEALRELHEKIKLCSECLTFSEEDPCKICGNPERDKSTICVVEDPSDQLALEESGAYNGVYHILHGAISPIDKIGPENIRIKELMSRIEKGNINEIIIATSSTRAGETTAYFLYDLLKDKGLKISRLAFGIPMGIEIKHVDKSTLSRSITYRQNFLKE